MKLIRHPSEMTDELRGGVIALGNFDGMHRGHMKVIGHTRKLAEEAGAPCCAMTFEPHPRRVFRPDLPPFRLTSLRLKSRLMEQAGVDYMYVQAFDPGFATTSPEAFVEDLLIGALGLSHLVVGFNYRFGKGREGSVETLARYARDGAFNLTVIDPQTLAASSTDPEGLRYSSTAVRDALTEGDCAFAARLLGRYWELEGRVDTGDARGRQLGFHTANVRLGDQLAPKTGVYAVRAGVDAGANTRWIDGVANFGNRPTFDKQEVLLETHLLDFSGDLYGKHLRVALIAHLRDEKKFDGLEALKDQISADILRAREVLAKCPGPDGPAAFPTLPEPATETD